MAEQDKDQHLDEMLDSLLASYSDAQPRPGMETRIRATLKTRAQQRRRAWMLVFAASVGVVLVALAITTARTAKPGVPANAGVPTHSPEVGPGPSSKFAAVPKRPTTQVASSRREEPFKSDTNKAILQMASLSYGDFSADATPPAAEKPYPVATRTQDQEPAIAQLPPAANISIQDLGVKPIEVKELAPTKDTDGKGNL